MRPAVTRSAAALRPARGLTLVECMVALAVLGILTGLAATGWQQTQVRRHLDGVAAQFETDVQFTRSLAVARNEALRLEFDGRAGAGCYVVHNGSAGGCTCGTSGPAACTGSSEALRVVRLEGASGVRMAANVAAIVFDPQQGTSTPAGTLRIEAADGSASVRQIVNIMGRVRSCSPDGVSGYKAC